MKKKKLSLVFWKTFFGVLFWKLKLTCLLLFLFYISRKLLSLRYYTSGKSTFFFVLKLKLTCFLPFFPSDTGVDLTCCDATDVESNAACAANEACNALGLTGKFLSAVS